MITELLPPVEKNDVEYKSSISQKRGGLVVWAGGEWRPVLFDQIMGVDCNRIITRKVYVASDEDLGYDYPIGECRTTSDLYAMFDRAGVVTDEMDEWFGTGFYKHYVNEEVIANFLNGALGTRNTHIRRLGLAYARAKETLEPVE